MNCLQALRSLSADQLAVRHNPMSSRYQRAGTRIDYILRHGSDLGQREHDERLPHEALETAVWAPPPSGAGPGYYACFRLEFDDGYPVFGVLFAFYDGTDQASGFASLDDARAFARANGFDHEDQN